MTIILDVANYILSKTGKTSIWKLNKLCYYAQAWHLTWTNKPLFNEDFSICSNGPISFDLMNIVNHKLSIDISDIPINDVSKLTDNEIESINIIINDYGNMDNYDIQELCLYELSYIKTKNGILTKKNIKKFYKKLLKKNL